jgi:hypothetical protein
MQGNLSQPAAGEALGTFTISWQDQSGAQSAASVPGIQLSETEISLSCRQSLFPGCVVQATSDRRGITETYTVRECRRRAGGYLVTAERERAEAPSDPDFEGPDLYEILQINPKADSETIHRVFRIMAARFHPDNPETGDREHFLALRRAHAVLSDPDRRSGYDEFRRDRAAGPIPIFEQKDFLLGIDAEKNRRLGVLSLLYYQRRVNSDQPGISLLDLERKMNLPREHLGFTMWFLRAKQWVTVADNSDYALTAEGAEYVEDNAGHSELLSWLLTRGETRMPARSERPGPPKGIEAPNLLESGSQNSSAH